MEIEVIDKVVFDSLGNLKEVIETEQKEWMDTWESESL